MFTGLFFTLLVLLGIVVWPEVVLCLILFYYGHWLLAVIAFLVSFWSGKQEILRRTTSKD